MKRITVVAICPLLLTLLACKGDSGDVAETAEQPALVSATPHEYLQESGTAHNDAHRHHKSGDHGHHGHAEQSHKSADGNHQTGTDHHAQARGADASPSRLNAAEVFNRRILPILRSDEKSSCTECHFGGVELRNYIHEDQATTFAALRNEGLIDVEEPDESEILTFISRHADDTNPLLAKVREAEFGAFRDWIRAAVQEPELLSVEAGDVQIGSELPPDVIRHMRRDRVLASFVENVWSQMGRCINCHSPERNQRLIEEHGDVISWIRPNDPDGTLEQCVDQGIIDIDAPEESLLLLKPLAVVEHGGGPKFVTGSQADRDFRRFLNDYAATAKQEYRRTEDLPTPAKFVLTPTGQHLRIVDLPERLHQKLLRADIHRWEGDDWSESPVATADNPIAGKRHLWQSMVFGVVPRDSERAQELGQSEEHPIPPGRYLVRIYIDQDDRVKADQDYVLGEPEFFGEVEFEGDWPKGYQPPKVIKAPAAPPD